MSKDQQLQLALAFLGDLAGQNKKQIGDLAILPLSIPATSRVNLVAALAHIIEKLETATEINDASTGADTTLSAAKIIELVSGLRTELLGGTDLEAARDTIKEISDELAANADVRQAIMDALGNRLRLDGPQNNSPERMAQGRANLGAASQSDHTALDGRVTTVETAAQSAADLAASNAQANAALASTVSAVQTTANTASEKGVVNEAAIAALDTDLQATTETANAAKTTADTVASDLSALTNAIGATGTDYRQVAENAFNAATAA